MTTEKTFFSYSRTDSDFVLKLAKDLRNSGVTIWLDQLDIKGGTHWDSAIETALNSSPNLIAVLSVESVKSNNVMDEISFALESGKRVIPVFLQECTVPFRLRRLQRIDFTEDYQTALNQLLEVLGRPAVSSSKEALTTIQNQPIEKTQSVSNGEEAIPRETKASLSSKDSTDGKPTEPKSTTTFNKKYLLIGAAAIIIIGLVIWLIAGLGSTAQDDVALEENSTQTSQETNSENTSQGIAIPDDLKIGDVFDGGYVFYIDSLGEHGLIVADVDYDVKSEAVDVTIFCKELENELSNYRASGFSDWRLPTMEELNLLFGNKDKIAGFNFTGNADAYGREEFMYLIRLNQIVRRMPSILKMVEKINTN